ncbi:MAG: cysteine hydrolase family protein [Pseudomonadota bacterium]
MDPKKTAIVLIGYQNDYFAEDGILHGVIEEASRTTGVLENTFDLIERLKPTGALMITTPIIFTPDYSELVDPVGILKVVKDVGAFKAGTKGAETIPQLLAFGDRILEVPGKRGLNAFSNTDLGEILTRNGVTDVVFAGAVTSICIDSTGRAAFERGYKVIMLGDCTSGRTMIEQDFYCDKIFPLYAEVVDHNELLKRLGVEK